MHVFIAGGSGQTGSLAIENLIEQGHTVTALVRNPSIVSSKAGLDLIQGTPVNRADIEKCFARRLPNAVIVTLTPAKGVFEDGSSFIAHVTQNIVQVMQQFGTSKIVYLCAFGVGKSYSNLNFLLRGAVCATPLGTKFAGHEEAEKLIKKATGIRSVIVKPAMLKNGEPKQVEYLGEAGEKASFMPSITRASVAKFMVEALTSEEWDGKSPVIANVQ
ncbi:hypothetical protein PISL3812_08046 [Talaromyces islandicus]|uniref:NAD(P)-binding domain-containing protein n=1 Tax=Talaromyces islandicus TaxID=28573 RepID=A0A0U1M5T4_TALIS|nr:hypothetical protein PISL3812_08046 [Talaromyces islandicus]